GFTTFSAFSLDFMVLWQRGEMVAAAGYVIASVVLSLVGIAAGMWIVRALA
ncbi:MAG: CrcB family protein, partial [Bauldia sp.]